MGSYTTEQPYPFWSIASDSKEVKIAMTFKFRPQANDSHKKSVSNNFILIANYLIHSLIGMECYCLLSSWFRQLSTSHETISSISLDSTKVSDWHIPLLFIVA